MDYNITLTEAQNKALAFIALSQQDWIENAVFERARIAIDEIVKICVDSCLENNIQIPGSKDEMVALAFEQGWVKSVAQRVEEAAVSGSL